MHRAVEQEAASFDSMITGWMAPPPAPPASNTSASPPPIHNERYPGCRDAPGDLLLRAAAHTAGVAVE